MVYWISKGTSNFAQEMAVDMETGEPCKHEEASFYDLISTEDTIENGIKVVEHSKFKKLLDDYDRLKRKLFIAEALIQGSRISAKEDRETIQQYKKALELCKEQRNEWAKFGFNSKMQSFPKLKEQSIEIQKILEGEA